MWLAVLSLFNGVVVLFSVCAYVIFLLGKTLSSEVTILSYIFLIAVLFVAPLKAWLTGALLDSYLGDRNLKIFSRLGLVLGFYLAIVQIFDNKTMLALIKVLNNHSATGSLIKFITPTIFSACLSASILMIAFVILYLPFILFGNIEPKIVSDLIGKAKYLLIILLIAASVNYLV